VLDITLNSVKQNAGAFKNAQITLPQFDIDAVRKETFAAPVWAHIGPGNLFRAFHAVLQQTLIEKGLSGKGIIAIAPVNYAEAKTLYQKSDNLFVVVVMKADGSLEKKVIGSVTEMLAADTADSVCWARLKTVFANPSLQMVTLAITEKGYDFKTMDGAVRPEIVEELDKGPEGAEHIMLKLCALLFERYKAGGAPLALVSTDNFSHNGDKLKAAMLTVAGEWLRRGSVEQPFLDYIGNKKKVSFPLSMIDKITPLPSERVSKALSEAGIAGMELVKTSGSAVKASFVNTEESEYLVIEDDFPNGRPPLEKAGVYFTGAEIVDKVERMKVCTCLNPLHTALAIFGCLLGFTSIAEEMADPDLKALVTKIAYNEGLPVVTDPGIIKPSEFVKEVLSVRFPNPNIPDTPQRIAMDTSQKLSIRFGETIKLYMSRREPGADKLVLIPLVEAAWCRYLLGVDDNGKKFTLSSDPLLAVVQAQLNGVELGKPETAEGRLKNILSNEKIFGVDLYAAGLGKKIEGYFAELIAGNGAVRKTLRKYTA
jgi:fructuronate reductase